MRLFRLLPGRKGFLMNEIKKPQKPLIIFYAALLILLMLFNFMLVPAVSERAIKDVDYGTFMTMTEKGEISTVQIQSDQILFMDQNKQSVYRTGLMNDPDLVNRLHEAGVEFSSEIQKQSSPMMSLIFSWVLPVALFYLLGSFLSKKMMDKAGGPNSLMFGMGKSNAKVYVKSSDGIRFDDVAGIELAAAALILLPVDPDLMLREEGFRRPAVIDDGSKLEELPEGDVLGMDDDLGLVHK